MPVSRLRLAISKNSYTHECLSNQFVMKKMVNLLFLWTNLCVQKNTILHSLIDTEQRELLNKK